MVIEGNWKKVESDGNVLWHFRTPDQTVQCGKGCDCPVTMLLTDTDVLEIGYWENGKPPRVEPFYPAEKAIKYLRQLGIRNVPHYRSEIRKRINA